MVFPEHTVSLCSSELQIKYNDSLRVVLCHGQQMTLSRLGVNSVDAEVFSHW